MFIIPVWTTSWDFLYSAYEDDPTAKLICNLPAPNRIGIRAKATRVICQQFTKAIISPTISVVAFSKISDNKDDVRVLTTWQSPDNIVAVCLPYFPSW